MKADINKLIPGGVLATDFVHIVRDDDTCSRCWKPIEETKAALMLWVDGENGDNVLLYCETCLGERVIGP